MLTRRVPTILPDLTSGKSIETMRIDSMVRQLNAGQPLVRHAPPRDLSRAEVVLPTRKHRPKAGMPGRGEGTIPPKAAR